MASGGARTGVRVGGAQVFQGHRVQLRKKLMVGEPPGIGLRDAEKSIVRARLRQVSSAPCAAPQRNTAKEYPGPEGHLRYA